MKLFELLESNKRFEGIAINEKYVLGVVYSTRFNCYLWCDRTGRVVDDRSDFTGYKRVILSPKLMERDDWSIQALQ